MDTTTINGLHSCKPGNDPVIGQVKLFTVIHNPPKGDKKAWIKIKAANLENGGTPYRILNAEPTGYTDKFGNISFNIEVEPSSSQPTAFQQARETMQQGRIPKDDETQVYKREELLHEPDSDWPEAQQGTATAPESPPARQNVDSGVQDARKHLMKAANLYALCVRCANSEVIAGEIPVVHRTNEQFQSTLASIWIEASSRRSDDGKIWWSYIDKMPDKLL